jgi:hypothetical protein
MDFEPFFIFHVDLSFLNVIFMSYMDYPSTLMLIIVSCLKKYEIFEDFILFLRLTLIKMAFAYIYRIDGIVN